LFFWDENFLKEVFPQAPFQELGNDVWTGVCMGNRGFISAKRFFSHLSCSPKKGAQRTVPKGDRGGLFRQEQA
jgi:hypothetical protein